METITLKLILKTYELVIGMVLSICSMSPDNLLRIFPIGFIWKNLFNDACSNLFVTEYYFRILKELSLAETSRAKL